MLLLLISYLNEDFCASARLDLSSLIVLLLDNNVF